MDILGKRYGNIQSLFFYVSWDEISDFLIFVMEEVNEDEIKNVYLSNPLQQESYKEFKERVMRDIKNQSLPKELRNAQAELNAMNLDNWFKERGGGNRSERI
ncbi:hypothetical protein [Globicatella sp. PHS-GS-PNBC-21-1553]|uniref:hypothetical protein n=1 Tax=Globicatella sp. PHS-GS-PNBC-21-1553 TaxID=2885764 RepID=UPI00298EF19F|nr:hypothetical protein [Globicatella sp. PHS-GS-PNBC-21-1553]WPC08012.1 hypothetical protein LB888_08130 [Globicatella sp. PHS-GS-PNBC-21-1553]